MSHHIKDNDDGKICLDEQNVSENCSAQITLSDVTPICDVDVTEVPEDILMESHQVKPVAVSSDNELIDFGPKAAKVKKSQITASDIENLIVKCSACGKQINHNDISQIKRHLDLGVLMCKECFRYYDDGLFSEDDAGYNYCRWCAKGGKLYGCDFCPNQFCLGCLRRNFNRGVVQEIKEVKWKCYICDPSPLKGKVNFCDMVFDYCKKLQKEQRRKHKKLSQHYCRNQVSNDSEADESTIVPSYWLPFHISHIWHLAGKLEKRMRMNKLKGEQEQHSKSSKQIVDKTEEIIKNHCKEIEQIVKTIKSDYERYTKWKMGNYDKDDDVYVNNGVFDIAISDCANANRVNDVSGDLGDNSVKPTEATPNGIIEEVITNSSVPRKNGSCSSNVNVEVESLNVPIHSEVTNPRSVIQCNRKDTENGQSNKTTPSEFDHDDDGDSDTQKSQALLSSSSLKNTSVNDSAVEIRERGEQDINSSHVEYVSDVLKKHSADFDTLCVEENSHPSSTDLPELDSLKHLSEDKAAKILILPKSGLNSKNDQTSPVLENISNVFLQSQSVLNKDTEVKSVDKKTFFGKRRMHELKERMLKTERKKYNVKHDNNKKSDNLYLSDISISSFSSSDSDNRTSEGKNHKIKKKCGSVAIKVGENCLLPSCSKQDAVSALSTNKCDESDMHKSIETIIKDSAAYFNDPKLLINLQVIVEKLVLDESNICDETEKMLKSTKKLLKKTKKIRESGEDYRDDAHKSKGKEKKVSKAKKKKLSFSDSDSEPHVLSSSSDLSDAVKMDISEVSRMKTPDKNQIAKEILLHSPSSNSSDSLSDDSETSSYRHKTSKTKTEGNLEKENKKKIQMNVAMSSSENASDADFEVPKKKVKQYKWLTIPHSDDNESEKSKEKPHKLKRKKKCVKRKIFSSDENENGAESRENSDLESGSSVTKNKPKGPRTKKHRQIKEVSRSSDASGKDEGADEPDNQDTPSGKGGKNIRKIISDKDLTDQTKEAAQAEKERRKRVAERQKLYNQITDTDVNRGTSVTRKMVLEVNEESKEEVVEIHPDIIEKLKPHQVNGVKFMWECTVESLKQLETTAGSGCILAHCMGLGKTLQVIAFLYTIFTNKYVSKRLRTAMVICPYNTVLNWAKEFKIWLEDAEEKINVFEMTNAKNCDQRKEVLQQWQDEGGVLILSYNIFRRLAEGNLPKASNEIKESVHNLLVDPGSDLVICDEGHILKNETSAVSKATSKLKTQRRIVLTGTPLQNNLKEYHCMVHFVKPHLLGTRKEFQNRFVNPLITGQCADSSQHDVKLMKKRVHILHKLLEGCVQRCDYSALTKFLPDKHEFVISVKLSENQIKMYRYFLDHRAQGRICGDKVEGRHLFTDYNALKNIWTHPYLCKLSYIRDQNKRVYDNESDSMRTSINDDTPGDDLEGNKIVCLDEQPGTSKEKSCSSGHEVVKTYTTQSHRRKEGEENKADVTAGIEEKHWWNEFFSEEDKYKLQLSGKMVLVFEILKECELIGDKLLIFSQSLLTLNMLEELLDLENQKTQNVEGQPASDILGSWVAGIDYFRMDGTTSVELRKRWIELFNSKENERARLFLISTKAGSLGTNLIGANRVILLDASWNPSHDVQAIFRVYRFGQVKPVYIYRFLAQGTMEEKIYDRQVTKLSLSCRVIDEQNIERHFNAADLQALYSFDPESQSNRPTPMVPKDRLMAEMLIKQKEWIVTYHEHDSLLQNVVGDDLTEEERQIAWQEYENEKEGLHENMGFLGSFDTPGPSVFSANESTVDAEGHMNSIIESIKNQNPKADSAYLLSAAITGFLNLIQYYQILHMKIKNKNIKMTQRGEQIPPEVNVHISSLERAIIRVKDCVEDMKMKQFQHMTVIKAKQQRQQEQQRMRVQQQAASFNYMNQFRTNINAANTYARNDANFSNAAWSNPTVPSTATNHLPRNTQNKFNQLRSQGITVTETSVPPGSAYVTNRMPDKNVNYQPGQRSHNSWRMPHSKNVESIPIITEIDENEHNRKGVSSHNKDKTPTSVTITEVE